MAKQVTRWEANDGTCHATEAAADRHDLAERIARDIQYAVPVDDVEARRIVDRLLGRYEIAVIETVAPLPATLMAPPPWPNTPNPKATPC